MLINLNILVWFVTIGAGMASAAKLVDRDIPCCGCFLDPSGVSGGSLNS